MIRRLVAALSFVAALAGSGAALAADYDGSYGQEVHRGSVPLCDSPKVLSNIAERYHWANTHTWGNNLAFREVASVTETQFRPGDPGLIDRRFCKADVYIADNVRPTAVYYLIEERMGFASIGWYVDFCVSGQDPWRVHDGWCRTVRPGWF
ncbi:hypothetical protein [Kaistia sp. MMO-174]|uniref:hypothetical protein n=1 Tax=Kaistia sp. MMO-174 TaxID=3081256 RepID=UPI001ACE82D2|nr:hypothetical protein [Hyphomicrobiales bacterium]